MRLPWGDYFLSLANVVAERSTCNRAHVGCVIVRDNRILSTGYNGSPPGMPHCEDEGCVVVNNHCQRTVHAEANAIATAARFGIGVDGATAYISREVCPNCRKLLLSAGVMSFVWSEKAKLIGR